MSDDDEPAKAAAVQMLLVIEDEEKKRKEEVFSQFRSRDSPIVPHLVLWLLVRAQEVQKAADDLGQKKEEKC